MANWGLYPVLQAHLQEFSVVDELQGILAQSGEIIARGLGRSYGDSSLGSHIISTSSFNRFLSFDEKTGILVCQAGVSLAEILDVFVPRGFFLPVTPGTKFVTVGGAVASDVHGKNHHVAGSFGRHVVWMTLMVAGGGVLRLSPSENAELFAATCGGMGLTGIILEVALRLIPIESAWIRQETIKAPDLDSVMKAFDESESWTYSVAWIDCVAKGDALGRCLLMRGEHATAAECVEKGISGDPLKLKPKRLLSVPFYFPRFVLNRATVSAFNKFYYGRAPEGLSSKLVDYNTFFYPLDGILHWNRIYGRRGFTQYQFVLPRESSAEGVRLILEKISQSGRASFLAVLKLFGPQDGCLSFPRAGYTLALDFPVCDAVLRLLDELDDLVARFGGRLYLTKDARMSAAFFRSSYGTKLLEFERIRHQHDAHRKFQSAQSRRLGIV